MSADVIAVVEDVVHEGRGGTRLKVDRLEVRRNEILGVVGPNGAGKSTLVRTIGLLEEPAGGRVTLFGQHATAANALSLRRRMACVFQSALLFDTTVKENVAAGLRFRGTAAPEIEKRCAHWMKALGIAHLADRSAREISGGEAQRVSLARALVLDPELLLMDEPFANLDLPTRQTLLEDLDALFSRNAATVVFVTHDREDVLRLASRTAVILGGAIAQEGLIDQVFNQPVSPEVAEFVGVETILAGRVTGREAGLSQVSVKGCSLSVLGERADGPILVCIRPEHVLLVKELEGFDRAMSVQNRIPGRVEKLTPMGFAVRVELDCGFPLRARITQRAVDYLGLEPGTEVLALVKASAIHCIRRERTD